MIVTCPDCKLSYDDAERSTICAHDPIFSNPEDLERKILALTLLEKTIRFAHEPNGPDRRVQFCNWNGMVELFGMVGEFAPHLFVIVKDPHP